MARRALSPSSVAEQLVPARCDRRVWLKHNRPELEDTTVGPFQEFLREQGIRHEERLLERLREESPDWVDIGGRDNKRALAGTIKAVEDGRELIYQGLLVCEGVEVGGEEYTVLGYPDFMLRTEAGYEILDAKLARAIYDQDGKGEPKLKSKREYIELQLQLYGWLFSRLFPDLTFTLGVLNGQSQREEVPYEDEGASVMGHLEKLVRIRGKAAEPWEPVGWSKCMECSFRSHCWTRAEADQETGLVPDLTQEACRRLRDRREIETYPELLAQLDAPALAKLKNPSAGPEDPKNLAGAERILENAQALQDNTEIIRSGNASAAGMHADLGHENYVMFDLEGVPPDIDQDWEKIYLWGIQVFGEAPGEFLPSFAGFGAEGDEEGWVEFLKASRQILDEHEGIRFVHWHSYEKAKIKQYMKRYPHTDLETAKEVKGALLDLYPLTKDLVALPLPSYSLKVVEQLPALTEVTGFERTADDVKSGDESIAAYMEAVETGDAKRRDELMGQLAAYNQEDLEATWAVLRYLRSLIAS